MKSKTSSVRALARARPPAPATYINQPLNEIGFDPRLNADDFRVTDSDDERGTFASDLSHLIRERPSLFVAIQPQSPQPSWLVDCEGSSSSSICGQPAAKRSFRRVGRSNNQNSGGACSSTDPYVPQPPLVWLDAGALLQHNERHDSPPETEKRLKT